MPLSAADSNFGSNIMFGGDLTANFQGIFNFDFDFGDEPVRFLSGVLDDVGQIDTGWQEADDLIDDLVEDGRSIVEEIDDFDFDGLDLSVSLSLDSDGIGDAIDNHFGNGDADGESRFDGILDSLRDIADDIFDFDKTEDGQTPSGSQDDGESLFDLSVDGEVHIELVAPDVVDSWNFSEIFSFSLIA